MSRAEVMSLLRREANHGYGGCMQCPHCEGSGLIGGAIPGYRSALGVIDNTPLTAAQRKQYKAAAAAVNRKPRKVLSPAQKIAKVLASAQAFEARGGVAKPKPKSRAYGDLASVLAELGLEQKEPELFE